MRTGFAARAGAAHTAIRANRLPSGFITGVPLVLPPVSPRSRSIVRHAPTRGKDRTGRLPARLGPDAPRRAAPLRVRFDPMARNPGAPHARLMRGLIARGAAFHPGE